MSGPRPQKMTPETVSAGVAHLRRADPVLAAVVTQVGAFRMQPSAGHFQSLARAIVAQQISGHAARTIWKRIAALSHPRPVTAEGLDRLSDAQLRAAGLSPQKLRYMRDLCRRIVDRRLVLARLGRLPDDAVIAELTQVLGIGVWTAQMFLMFSLRRSDVFPPDDLGIRAALRKLYGLSALPDRATSESIAAAWAPYRSVASWYLWRSLELPPTDA
ncbi:MAG: DNA-3-methyladenine glycosylase 2 family protein [Planctomyces sp.]|nr:DNA-3-methyladenine glycosylase 2 family protein [Planctomyces sp.]